MSTSAIQRPTTAASSSSSSALSSVASTSGTAGASNYRIKSKAGMLQCLCGLMMIFTFIGVLR